LFGRDSLWMLLLLLEAERLGVAPTLSGRVERAGARILGALARLQGARVDDAIEEQPGKILHEQRELLDARLRAYGMPFVDGRSYASFDATFLFVCGFAAYAARFPQHAVNTAVWPAVERALTWIEDYADADGDGLYEYCRRDRRNPRNQVWKDSFDSVSTLSGFDVPPDPVAWIEVQAYAHRALEQAAGLHDARGDRAEAERLRARARRLQKDAITHFWLGDEECLAMAVDARKEPLREISTNAGHALWGGLLDDYRAERLAARLRRPDLLTPWGLRCLSAASGAYAPFAYHRGSVWPFDNGVVAAGLLRHGFAGDAIGLAEAVGRALLRLGTATELYVVIDGELLVEPPGPASPLLVHRRGSQENLTQGFTAAAAVFFATLLASAAGIELPDR
jgi:glycogen debranching enzyme